MTGRQHVRKTTCPEDDMSASPSQVRVMVLLENCSEDGGERALLLHHRRHRLRSLQRLLLLPRPLPLRRWSFTNDSVLQVS